MSAISIDVLRENLRSELKSKFPQAHRVAGECSAVPQVESSLKQGRGKLDKLVEHPGRENSQWTAKLTAQQGRIGEVVSDERGGNLVLELLLKQHQDCLQLALIDARNRFDPASYPPSLYDNLLWLKIDQEREFTEGIQRQQAVLWKVADWLLSDGNFPLVILDVRGVSEALRVPRGHWYRLRNQAEEKGVALVVLSSAATVPCASNCWYVERWCYTRKR